MKTFEEIKKHLAQSVYSVDALDSIFAFLIRENIDLNNSIYVNCVPLQFKDFLKWYDSEEPSKKTEDSGEKKYKISGEKRKLIEREYSTLKEMLKVYENLRDEAKRPFLKEACTDLIKLIKEGIEFAESELNATVD